MLLSRAYSFKEKLIGMKSPMRNTGEWTLMPLLVLLPLVADAACEYLIRTGASLLTRRDVCEAIGILGRLCDGGDFRNRDRTLRRADIGEGLWP